MYSISFVYISFLTTTTIYHPPCSVGEQPLASRAWTACSCLITEEKAYGITVTCINQNSWWWRGECFDLNVDDVHHDEECEEQDQYSWHYQLDVLKYEKLRLETRSSPFFRDALNASSLILCFEGIKSLRDSQAGRFFNLPKQIADGRCTFFYLHVDSTADDRCTVLPPQLGTLFPSNTLNEKWERRENSSLGCINHYQFW